MSHTSLMVIGENVEDQLKPFDENQQTQPYWVPVDNPPWEMQYLRDEHLIDTNASLANNADAILAALKKAFPDAGYRVVDDALERLETYPREVPGPNGGLISAARWDWYSVGGRWDGFLLAKTGEEVNVGLNDDIDWSRMRQSAEAKALAQYDKFKAAVGDLLTPGRWDVFRQGYDDIEDAREAYHGHPFIKALKNAQLMPWSSDVHDHFCLDAPHPQAAYTERAGAAASSTFAFLREGEWFERGHMGWFGLVDEESEMDAWLRLQSEMIDSLPGDALITIVDVHI